MKPIIFGSRSPRRRELMLHLISESRLLISPPTDEQEEGFDGLQTLPEIRARILEIAGSKLAQVHSAQTDENWGAIFTADTVVVAESPDRSLHVLGKPDGPHWQQTVRDWFRLFYSGRSHQVITGVTAIRPDGTCVALCEATTVRFNPVTDQQLDWYLESSESLGKAGGYAIQGAAGLFVNSIEGSLTNIIGLPIEQVWKILNDWDLL